MIKLKIQADKRHATFWDGEVAPERPCHVCRVSKKADGGGLRGQPAPV